MAKGVIILFHILSLGYFTSLNLERLAKGVEIHKASVFTLSFGIAAFSSFLMWIAYRRIRSEKWMFYFACSFGLLGLQYLWLLLVWFFSAHPNNAPPAQSSLSESFLVLLVLIVLSTANNLFAVSAARDIENKRPLMPRVCWVLLVGSLITILFGYASHVSYINKLLPYHYDEHPLLYEIVTRSFPSYFSAYCLFLVGYAIFANLSKRRHFWIASAAVVIASTYAGVQLAYGLSPLLSGYFITVGNFSEKLALLDALLIGTALPLKICLCAFAYLLVTRFFETLNEVRKLQDTGVDGRQDYLSSDGVVKLIGLKLSDRVSSKSKGYVNLVVRLPGENNKRVACILWPNPDKDRRVKIFDWIGPTKFSRLLLDNHPEAKDDSPWAHNLEHIGTVLTQCQQKEINSSRSEAEIAGGAKSGIKAVVTVAIEAHGAAIGCLQIARETYDFSQMALRQIREIANLVSPGVQAYRELAALDQMSIRFAERQAEETTYRPEEATNIIARILHDVFSPTVTRFHMNFGFCSEDPVYLQAKGKERVVEKMKEEFAGKRWEDFRATIVDRSIASYALLKKRLTARLTETLSTEPLSSNPDRFITGNLLLAVNEVEDEYDEPALGVTYLHRKAASTLAADAYLDFARDHYNDLLKNLGKEMSLKRVNVEDWFQPIKSIVDQSGLSWVLAEQRRGGGRLGDSIGSDIVDNLDELAINDKAINIGEVEIGSYYQLKGTHSESNHVLRIDLQNSEWCLWLGVERLDFGPELDFSSPWRTFLANFAQIADAALSRITIPQKFQVQIETAQLQGIISALVTTGTIIHQLSNMIQGQESSASTLIESLKLGKLSTDDDDVERIIYAMKSSAERMQEMFRSFNRLNKMDEHSPCQLKEAARHAFKLFQLSLIQRQIDFDMDIESGLYIDVPFNVAALALANLVGNAKDAVSKDGKIFIDASTNGNSVLCRVIDNGRGIPDEIRHRLFEPRITTKATGTGLGLYLTHHSLNENRSSIELTKSDETGSVFTIRFPLAKKEATNERSNSSGKDRPGS